MSDCVCNEHRPCMFHMNEYAPCPSYERPWWLPWRLWLALTVASYRRRHA